MLEIVVKPPDESRPGRDLDYAVNKGGRGAPTFSRLSLWPAEEPSILRFQLLNKLDQRPILVTQEGKLLNLRRSDERLDVHDVIPGPFGQLVYTRQNERIPVFVGCYKFGLLFFSR